MLYQLNHEASRNIITLNQLGTLLLVMLYQLSYEANRNISTLPSWYSFLATLYHLNKETNQNINTLTSWPCLLVNALPTEQNYQANGNHYLTIIVICSCICSNSWTMKQIETSSPSHLNLVFQSMTYQLNYEANPNIITLNYGHHFAGSALAIETWSKS